MIARAVVPLTATIASALAYAVYARLEPRWLALGWVGLVPWLVALDRAASWRRAVVLGLLMAVSFTLAVFGWFARAVQTYTGLPLAPALVVVALGAPLVQPQFPVFALARHLARRRLGTGLTALAGACAYVGSEWALPKLFGDTLGHGLYASSWMRQAADLAGAPGLTLVLLLANAAGVEAWRALAGGARRAAACAPPIVAIALLVVALSGYGALRLRQLAALPATPSITAGIVQGNVGHYDQLRAEIGSYATVRMVLDTYFAMSEEILRRHSPDMLVWPETVYPTTFGAAKSPEGAAFDREIVAFATRSAVPIVFGAYEVERGAEFNAAFFLEPPGAALANGAGVRSDDARLVGSYRKARPFPLTERVPRLLDTPAVRARLPWLGTWEAGAGARVIDLRLAGGRTLRIAPLICYDVLDPPLALAAVRDGAELIVTLSNDSWFADGAGPRQHLLGAAFRSIETHRPQLRATNTGISAVISPTGEIVARADLDVRGGVVATVVPERRGITLAVAWGDWLGPVALVLAGTILTLTLPGGRFLAASGHSPRDRER